MGWTFTHRDKGITTDDWFKRELIGDGDYTLLRSAVVDKVWYAAVRRGSDGEVSCVVVLTQWSKGEYNYGWKSMDEFMGPNEAKCPDRVLDLLTPIPECDHSADGEVCALCSATIVDRGGIWIQEPRKGWHVEVPGPCCYSGYPYGTPTPGEGRRPFHQPGGTHSCGKCYARKWREACRKYNAKPKVTKGARVHFTRPIEFTDGTSLADFEFVERNLFRALHRFENEDGSARFVSGGRYRITGWKDHAYEVVV